MEIRIGSDAYTVVSVDEKTAWAKIQASENKAKPGDLFSTRRLEDLRKEESGTTR